MKKKIIALTLAIMMLCSTIFSHTVVIANAGGTEPTITVETVNAYRGDTDVTVNISISNNPGIVYMQLEIAYPTEKLELVSGTDTGLLKGWLTPSGFESSNPTYVTWDDGLAETNNANNGNILTLKFKVKNFEITESTKFGLADIIVSYDEEQVFDVNMDNVSFAVVNGGINVACKHDGATYLKNEKPTSCFEMGYTGDKYCDICDEKIDDGEDIPKSSHSPSTDYSHNTTHHWKDCLTIGCGNEIDKEEHLGGTKTCTAQAICSVCNQPYGDKAPHTYTVPQKDTDDHWNKCANCDAIDTKVAHTFDQKVKNTNTLKDAADCDEDAVYYFSCTCGQVSTTLTFVDTGSATQDHKDADGNWEYNDTKHWHTCECSKIIDEEDHNGGTKTCTTQAVCVDCQQPYGDKAPHSYTVPQKDADDHWNKCANCDAIDTKVAHTFDQKVKNANTLKDAADCDDDAVYYLSCTCGQISITLTFVDTGSATGNHIDADGQWETDGTKHWHTCECGETLDEENHKGGNKTCTAQAICSVCNKAYGDKAPHTYNVPQKDADDHWNKCANCDAIDTKVAHTFDQKVKNTNALKDAADCDEDAVYYLSCTCGQVSTTLTFVDTGSATQDHKDADGNWETNGTKHWHTCECSKILDEEDHKGGTATCTDQATCSVCNVKYGTKNADNHTGGTEIKDAVPVKCDQDGYTGDTYCKGCGEKIVDGEPILKGHRTVKVPYAKETHDKDGNIEYYTCSGCDLLFSDEAATTIITLDDTVIEKGEHSYGESYEKDNENHWKQCACGNIIENSAHTMSDWTVTKEATKTEKGCKEKTCSVCGYKVTEDIPVLESNNDDKPNSPQTGDNNNLLLWVVLMFISVTCLTVITVYNKKRKHNR